MLLRTLLFSSVLAATVQAQEAAGGSVAMTIYSTAESGAVPAEVYRPVTGAGTYQPASGANLPGYAIIKQERPLDLEKGRSSIRFTDVAALIDPTTVSFVSLSDPATRVIEQNFQFDLVNHDRLMQRYIDRPVTVEQSQGDRLATASGTLLSTSGGLILKDADGGVQIVNGYSNIKLPELPGGLITRPTLVWDLVSEKGGTQNVRVSYETGGMTWWADYNFIFTEGKDANSGVLDVGAWVSILNQSGAGYPDAKLKLVAGKLHRAPKPMVAQDSMRMRRDYMAAEASMAGFEEKGFFEYHLYTLGRPTTLPDQSTKQIELFPAVRNVPCDRVLVYYGLPSGFPSLLPDPVTDRDFGTQSNKEVDSYLRFKNSKDVGLGMPMPAGRIRVSKLDSADNTLEFIGEDRIGHTPKDETVLIKLGTAFDVVGERKQLDFKLDTTNKLVEEEIEVTLRNHKEEAVTVIVKENLYRWTTWQILQKSHDFQKVDARTIHFPVNVAKDGETTLRYRVRYSW